MPHSPDYDVVLFGASGYTGQLVAEYLMHRTGGERFALAGRNRAKLEQVRATLGAPHLPLLLGDSHDSESLRAIAKNARVICSTVGPYAVHGNELVAVCAEEGVSYCDLTGETHWIRRMIDAHEQTAARTGARIVHCCGFDSVPVDLGTFFLQQHAIKTLGGPCEAVHAYLTSAKGSVSGGTVASIEGVLAEARRDPEVRKLLQDPYGLNPEGERSGPDGADLMVPSQDPEMGWLAPHLTGAADSRIVRRSNAVLGYPYGRDFRFAESVATGTGVKGLAIATAITAATAGLVTTMSLPPLKKLLGSVIPQPGSGPSLTSRNSGHFTYEFVGTRGAQRVRCRVHADRDPGYGATSQILGEAALCLAQDGAGLPVQGGSWTPAAAMGDRLVERLSEAGIVFQTLAN